MQDPRQLKQEFLRKWAKNLQMYRDMKNNMSLLERKKAIKLSADVAMASARSDATCWGRALIANASNTLTTTTTTTKVAVAQHVFAQKVNTTNNYVCWTKQSSAMCKNIHKKVGFKKILKKSCALARQRKIEVPRVLAARIANKMVRKRTQMLKTLVPGGELMDGVSVIQEALDYIVSLQIQVKLMRQLVINTSHLQNHREKE